MHNPYEKMTAKELDEHLKKQAKGESPYVAGAHNMLSLLILLIVVLALIGGLLALARSCVPYF